ncbi:MAG: hypothetical protein R2940_01930 [Syntrophotaleaceae bacterium]
MSAFSTRPTTSKTIRQLAEQLAHWGESLIAHGRSPLRRIETFPSLLTPCGCQNPPLVFWINRDSFMAGAVVLFPDSNDPPALHLGQCCSQALGLAYFITWTARKITFWDARQDQPVARKQFELDNVPSVEGFQEALQKLMDEAKIMAVVGAVPPPQLSSSYFANLYRFTLSGVRSLLVDTCRMSRIDRKFTRYDVSADDLADSKNFLTLVRLLSLILENPPTSIAPRELDSVLRAFARTLPDPLRLALQEEEHEIALPEEAAVRFHLLYRRLTQLQAATDPDRHSEALSLLLQNESRHLGGFPLPFPPAEKTGQFLLLNPDRCYAYAGPILEVAPRSVLAMTALLRHLLKSPAAEQAWDLWQLPFSSAPGMVSGTLGNGRYPDADCRRNHLAMLRTSWPTRRFRLPDRSPEWAWQFLHLLGMAAEGAVIELRLPNDWPAADFGRPLFQLIQEQFTLDRIEPEPENLLLVRLFKSILPDHVTRFRLADGSERRVNWQKLRRAHPSILRLSLHLPENLQALLDTGRLVYPQEDSWSSQHEKQFSLFLHSSLGHYLWKVVSNGRRLPGRKSLRLEMVNFGLPVPEPAGLAVLQRHFPREDGPPPSTREIDRVLASWLGTEPLPPVVVAPQLSSPPRSREEDGTELARQIGDHVFIDGVPVFPDHYLFDYYRPRLQEYSFEAPLVCAGQFFETFELRDASGNLLRIEGAELARALLLSSATASGPMRLSLPEDRQILAAILERYQADLGKLRQNLLREIHRLNDDPKGADHLADSLWRERNLPPWSLIAEEI